MADEKKQIQEKQDGVLLREVPSLEQLSMPRREKGQSPQTHRKKKIKKIIALDFSNAPALASSCHQYFAALLKSEARKLNLKLASDVPISRKQKMSIEKIILQYLGTFEEEKRRYLNKNTQRKESIVDPIFRTSPGGWKETGEPEKEKHFETVRSLYCSREGKAVLSIEQTRILQEHIFLKVLHSISASPDWKKPKISFHGGTALHMVYNSARFSSDLDFVIAPELIEETKDECSGEVRSALDNLFLKEIAAKLKEYPFFLNTVMKYDLGITKIDVKKKAEKENNEEKGMHINVYSIKFDSEFYQIPEIKCEFCVVDPQFLEKHPVSLKQILAGVSSVNGVINVALPVSNIEAVLAEKTVALAGRQSLKVRDLYDMFWILKNVEVRWFDQDSAMKISPVRIDKQWVEKVLCNTCHMYRTNLATVKQGLENFIEFINTAETPGEEMPEEGKSNVVILIRQMLEQTFTPDVWESYFAVDHASCSTADQLRKSIKKSEDDLFSSMVLPVKKAALEIIDIIDGIQDPDIKGNVIPAKTLNPAAMSVDLEIKRKELEKRDSFYIQSIMEQIKSEERTKNSSSETKEGEECESFSPSR